MNRIYLDNAATSWPKPAGVTEAMVAYLQENGAPAGRSGYAEANETARLLQDCRRQLAQLVGAAHPQQVVFGFNGTDVLNMAIHGALRDGDHVVTTVLEHNSVLRPLHHWSQHGDVEVTFLEPGADGRVPAESLQSALRPNTRLAILTHASNVTGVVQPVEAWGEAVSNRRASGARGANRDTLFLVDAAQSLGHMPVDVSRMQADMVAASTHKGVRGPLGTAMLYVGAAAEQLRPWRQGGTGTQSESPQQPDELPERLESGNLNVVGLVGLAAALKALEAMGGPASVAPHEQQLTERLRLGLAALSGVQIQDGVSSDCDTPPPRTGVVSVTVEGFEPQELATMLDVSFRIQTRAGLHCAPLTHQHLGTLASGGTLRFSVGPENTEAHIDAAIDAVASLVNFE